jgi:Kinesin motor domain
MSSPTKQSQNQTTLFQVYLRLRPPISQLRETNIHPAERYLTVEPPTVPEGNSPGTNVASNGPTHITLHPPNDSRKRAVEKFAFTKVFEEDAQQLNVFEETGMPSLINGVLSEGRDGLVATLGVTGSGKARSGKHSQETREGR